MSIDKGIARGQQAMRMLLRDAALITHTPLVSDGRGGYVPGTPTATATVANVRRTLGASEQVIADRLAVVSPAVIQVPVDTVLVASDTITVNATHTFQVVSPLENTIQLTLKLLCKEL